MNVSDDEARELLDRATVLTATATKSTAYMATYFRIWGAGSVILALALFFYPRIDQLWYLLALMAVWAAFLVVAAVKINHGRPTPRQGPAMTLGVVGGSVPWTLMTITPLRESPDWRIQGLAYLIGGLVCAICLFLAARMLERRAA